MPPLDRSPSRWNIPSSGTIHSSGTAVQELRISGSGTLLQKLFPISRNTPRNMIRVSHFRYNIVIESFFALAPHDNGTTLVKELFKMLQHDTGTTRRVFQILPLPCPTNQLHSPCHSHWKLELFISTCSRVARRGDTGTTWSSLTPYPGDTGPNRICHQAGTAKHRKWRRRRRSGGQSKAAGGLAGKSRHYPTAPVRMVALRGLQPSTRCSLAAVRHSIFIYIYININIRDIQIFKYSYIHISYIQTYIHTYMHTYIHTYVHTNIHISIHPSIHPSLRTYIHTYT